MLDGNMSRTHFKTAIGILLSVAVWVPTVTSQAQRAGTRSRTAAADPCPDEKTYTGRYRNIVFGFAIVIPAGLKGYWNSARCAPDEKYGCVCMGDHGRFIPLSEDAHIEAFVGYEMDSEWSLRDYENEEISALKKQPGLEDIKVLGSRWFRLGNLKARRFTVQFVEKNNTVITDHIIALHRGVEYELILRTLPSQSNRDKRESERVIASWKLTPRL